MLNNERFIQFTKYVYVCTKVWYISRDPVHNISDLKNLSRGFIVKYERLYGKSNIYVIV